MPILHLFFGLLKSLTFLTLMHSLLRVLCTHIIITSFLIRLTPPLLLIAKYTHIILEMLITTDLISVEQTLNSSQSSPYRVSLNITLCKVSSLYKDYYYLTELTSYSSFKISLKRISHEESYKLNSPDHDMAAYIKS